MSKIISINLNDAFSLIKSFSKSHESSIWQTWSI